MIIQISRKRKISLLILFGIIFLSTYAVYPYRTPGGFAYPSSGPFQMIVEENGAIDTRSTPGHDSILQLKTAHLIADGKLDKSNWEIALGYSVLLIPFLSSIHAFLIPDLLMFVGTMYCTFSLAARFSDDERIGYITIVSLLALTGFLYYFVEPEKQHINEFGFMAIAYWLYSDPNRISKYKIISIGLILGWVFWSNYIDIIYFIPILGVFLGHKPRKIIWLFPCAILILGLFALQDFVFGNPFYYGVGYQNYIINFAQNQTIPYIQNLEGVKVMSFDPHIILKRTYCMLIEPQKCQPISYGILHIDEYNKSLIPPKRAILVGSTAFFLLAPYGFLRTILRHSGYQRRILLSILACFIVGIGFWISIFMWHAGGSPFWRYEMVWYPLLSVFAMIGLADLYKRIFKKIIL